MVLNHMTLNSIARFLTVKPPTSQESALIMYYYRVKNLTAASRMAGMTRNKAKEVFEQDNIGQIFAYLAEQEMEDFEVTRGMLNDMLLEAWSNSENATEQTGVVREMAKINGHYPGAGLPAQQARTFDNASIHLTKDENGKQQATLEYKNIRDIQQLDDEKLAAIAGNRFAEAITEKHYDDNEDDDMVYDRTLDTYVPASEVGD